MIVDDGPGLSAWRVSSYDVTSVAGQNEELRPSCVFRRLTRHLNHQCRARDHRRMSGGHGSYLGANTSLDLSQPALRAAVCAGGVDVVSDDGIDRIDRLAHRHRADEVPCGTTGVWMPDNARWCPRSRTPTRNAHRAGLWPEKLLRVWARTSKHPV
jgi:hypothetical protein